MVKCFMDLEFNLSDANAASGRYGMECVSIGACFVDEDNMLLEEFYSLIKPKRNAKLGHYYAKLTHLSQEEIYKAKNFTEVMNEFEQVYSKYNNVTIFTWGTEDGRMLFRDMKTNDYSGKLRSVFRRIVDLQAIISRNIRYDNFVIKQQWSLKDMQIIYDTPKREGHHNALIDSLMLMDIYIAYEGCHEMNQQYLNTFITKNIKAQEERIIDYEDSKISYFKPNRMETYMDPKGWVTLNKDFLKYYPMIKKKYYGSKKIIVTINNGKIDFFYVLNKDDLGHLHLILDAHNFRRIRKYLNNLGKTGHKDVL